MNEEQQTPLNNFYLSNERLTGNGNGKTTRPTQNGPIPTNIQKQKN